MRPCVRTFERSGGVRMRRSCYFGEIGTKFKVAYRLYLAPNIIAKIFRCSPTSLLRTNPRNNNGPATYSSQNKEIFMVGWLSGHLHATRCRSPRLPTSLSHPAPQGLRQPTRHNCRFYMPLCWQGPYTVEQFLRWCPNPVVIKQTLLGKTSILVLVLTTDPDSVLALSRQILS